MDPFVSEGGSSLALTPRRRVGMIGWCLEAYRCTHLRAKKLSCDLGHPRQRIDQTPGVSKRTPCRVEGSDDARVDAFYPPDSVKRLLWWVISCTA